jgi:hypothetical protein
MTKKIRHNWFVILLICILFAGCSSQSQEQAEQSAQYSEPAETASESGLSYQEPSFNGYKIIEVDGGDLSGYREANVAVDVGFGDREYWAFTNEYGQLVRVTAKEIVLQDDKTEPVKSNGRYYDDQADVPGTERADMDKGHIIADCSACSCDCGEHPANKILINKITNQLCLIFLVITLVPLACLLISKIIYYNILLPIIININTRFGNTK